MLMVVLYYALNGLTNSRTMYFSSDEHSSGVAFVCTLRQGMRPMPGVKVTLITKDVDTPYSGMLPGHIAGVYTRDECHIDLQRLVRFANARLIQAEVQCVSCNIYLSVNQRQCVWFFCCMHLVSVLL